MLMFSQMLLILAFNGYFLVILFLKIFFVFFQNKIVYNAEEDIARAEAEVNKAPNLELLDHEYKQLIEIKCVEFEDLMGGKV